MTDFALQLYSARFTPIADALAIVADAGYACVEAYGDNFADEPAFQHALQANGLTVCSIHVRLEDWRNSIPAVFERAEAYGVKRLVVPYLEPEVRPATAGGWQEFAQELNTYALACAQAGYSFAWHNHDFEFVATDDGQIPMRILLNNAPNMMWEIDSAWVFRAGVVPLEWVTEYSDRINAVHLKDVAAAGECEDEDGWADFGYGVVDWPALIALLRKKEDLLYAIEHDTPAEFKRFATRSIERAQRLLTA